MGPAVVVSCIDQPQRGLLHAAIERGLRYTDITPHLVELGRGAAYEQLDAAAKASGSRVLLGAGLVPGISNVIVEFPAPIGPRRAYLSPSPARCCIRGPCTPARH